MGQSRPLLCLFSHHKFNNTNWKKCRWCAWDSNPQPQDGGRWWSNVDELYLWQEVIFSSFSVICEQFGVEIKWRQIWIQSSPKKDSSGWKSCIGITFSGIWAEPSHSAEWFLNKQPKIDYSPKKSNFAQNGNITSKWGYVPNKSKICQTSNICPKGDKSPKNNKSPNLWHCAQTRTSRQKLSPLRSSVSSVTRLGNLLDFGQLFKAFGNN